MKSNLLLKVLAGLALLLIVVYYGKRNYDYKGNYYTSYQLSTQLKVQRNGFKQRLVMSYTNKVLPLKFDYLAQNEEGTTSTVFFYNGKRGYVDTRTGEELIPAQYKYAWQFSEGLAGVVKDSLLGFINRKGETVLPFKYRLLTNYPKNIDFLFHQGMCVYVSDKDKCGLINKQGDVVLPAKYEYINKPVNGFRIVKDKGKYGVMDSTFTIVLPIENENILLLDSGVVVEQKTTQFMLAYDFKTVLHNKLWDGTYVLPLYTGEMNENGDEIIVPSDYIQVRIASRYGVVNKKGDVIIKPQYESVRMLTSDIICVTMNNMEMLFDTNGVRL